MEHRELKTVLHRPTRLSEKTRFCPEHRTLAAYFDGALTSADREALQRHVADCRYCQARLGLLARLEQGAAEVQVPEEWLATAKQLGARPRQRRLRHAPTWTVAALLVLAVSMTTFRGNLPTTAPELSPPAAQPGDTGNRQLRSIDRQAAAPRLLAPVEGALVDPASLVIRWTPSADVLFYDLFVMNDAGDLVVAQRVEGNEWAIGQDGLLIPGSEYFARVEAHLADSRTLSTEHVAFRVSEGD